MVKQKHEMYLNNYARKTTSEDGLVKQKHEMYLNTEIENEDLEGDC